MIVKAAIAWAAKLGYRMAAGLLATRCDSAAADLRRVGAAKNDYVD